MTFVGFPQRGQTSFTLRLSLYTSFSLLSTQKAFSMRLFIIYTMGFEKKIKAILFSFAGSGDIAAASGPAAGISDTHIRPTSFRSVTDSSTVAPGGGSKVARSSIQSEVISGRFNPLDGVHIRLPFALPASRGSLARYSASAPVLRVVQRLYIHLIPTGPQRADRLHVVACPVEDQMMVPASVLVLALRDVYVFQFRQPLPSSHCPQRRKNFFRFFTAPPCSAASARRRMSASRPDHAGQSSRRLTARAVGMRPSGSACGARRWTFSVFGLPHMLSIRR